MRTAVLAVLASCLLATPALAQFFPDTPTGIATKPVAAAERLGLAPADPLVLAAGKCSGLKLDAMFRVQGGMSRFFELESGAGGKSTVNELAVSSAKPQQHPAVTAVDYQIDGQPIYVGMGAGAADGDGYADYVVASFLKHADGSIEELDRFVLGAPYSSGVYAMDVVADGVVELVCPYMTGAGGGGGIDIRAVVPTGGLAFFGDDEIDSTLWSQTGYCNLLDYDGDGNWEIETLAPVLCSACGYEYADLFAFNAQTWQWEVADSRFPAFYKPEQDFYRQLNGIIKQLAAGPEKFRYSGKAIEAQYAAQIGGQYYSLDPFVTDGKPNQDWVQALADFVRPWK